jgi:hypothetical protein
MREFQSVCNECNYDAFQRLPFVDAVKLVQSIGYLSDPRRTDPNGAEISVIEEQCCAEMWRILTANCHTECYEDSESGQLAADASIQDIKVFLLAVMGVYDIPWMKAPVSSVQDELTSYHEGA